MFIKVTENIFRDWMNEYCPNSFSYEGLSLLFDFLEQLENDSESGSEFCPSEVNDNYDEDELRNIAKDYNLTYEGYADTSTNEDEEEENPFDIWLAEYYEPAGKDESTGELWCLSIYTNEYLPKPLSALRELYNSENDIEDDEELVTYDWETMTDEMVEEIVKEYLQNETCLVGITKQGTAVYMSF